MGTITTTLMRHRCLVITLLVSAWDFCFFPPTTSVGPLPAPDSHVADLGSARMPGSRHDQLVKASTLDLSAPTASDL